MHVYSYKVKLEPLLWHSGELTAELLAGRLPGDAVIREFASHSSGAHLVSVALRRDRDSHEEALNELLLAAQELGYTFVEGEITRIADRAIETAFGFSVGGLGVGSATEKGELAVMGAFVGWCVGLLVGANLEKVEVMYSAQWTGAGWHLTRVAPQAAPGRAAFQAGY
jgi:hypothetical protein